MSYEQDGAVRPDYDQAIAFLARWYESASRVLTSIAPDRSGAITTTTFGAGDDAAIRAWLEQHGASRNIYFTVNPLRGPVTRKAAKTDVATLAWLHLDIDPRAGEEIAAEQERALRVLRAPPGNVPPPTVIVFSGGGYQGFWKLAEPVPIDGDVVAADDAARFNVQLEVLFGADHCHNVDRIMRLPGTINRPDAKKRKKGRTEALAELVEWHDDRVYAISAFPKAAPVGHATTGQEPSAAQPTEGPAQRFSSVDDLPDSVSQSVKDTILHGRDPNDPHRFGDDRSRWLWWVCLQLARANVPDEMIRAIITDPKFAISESVLDKGRKAERYVRRQIQRARRKSTRGLPSIRLPEGSHKYRDFAIQIAPSMANYGWYSRNGSVVKVEQEKLALVTPEAAVTEMEAVASFYRVNNKGGTYEALINKTVTRNTLASTAFLEELPPIRAVYPCPIFADVSGRLVCVKGYNDDTGILARGELPIQMSIDRARDVLLNLLRDYQPATDNDLSRLVVGLISPALNFGRLIGSSARDPAIMVEADDSQAGKGLYIRTRAKAYGCIPASVAQRKGVGSIEEAISRHLINGKQFIYLDNLRGELNCPLFESALTEPLVDCRSPFLPGVSVDPSYACFAITSNGVKMTRDQANRSSIVRIKKQPKGYKFHKWPEGSLEDHVEANRALYLGAILAIIKEWHRRGRPRAEDDGGHDFRPWATVVRYIAQEILGLADPIAGLRDLQARASSHILGWLREVVLKVVDAHRDGEKLTATDLVEILVDAGVEVPGLDGAPTWPLEESNLIKARQQLGRRLRKVFQDGDEVEVDGWKVVRVSNPDEQGHTNYQYLVHTPNQEPSNVRTPF